MITEEDLWEEICDGGWHADFALAKLLKLRGIYEIPELLCDRSLSNSERLVARARGLVALRDVQTIERLFALVDDAVPTAWEAVDIALAGIASFGGRTTHDLMKLLEDPDIELQFKVAEAFTKMPGGEYVLEALVEQADNSRLRLPVAWGLALLGEPGPIMRLIDNAPRLFIPRLLSLGAQGVFVLCQIEHMDPETFDLAASGIACRRRNRRVLEKLAGAGNDLAKEALERMAKFKVLRSPEQLLQAALANERLTLEEREDLEDRGFDI
jgi:hypothetical protein